jgi:membrane fusion protein, multidrug efflux system
MNRRYALIALLVAFLAAGGWFGLTWWTDGRFVETTDNASIEADIAVVAPKVAGYIRSVAVSDNQAVRAGDVLFTLDDSDYRAAVTEAETAVEAARAALATAQADARRQGAAIDEAQAGVIAAQADWTQANQDLARYKELRANQFASAQKYDAAAAGEARARASVEKGQAGLALAKSQVSVLSARVVQARAGVDQAIAHLQAAQIALDSTVVRAGVDGVIGNRRPGRPIRPSGTTGHGHRADGRCLRHRQLQRNSDCRASPRSTRAH